MYEAIKCGVIGNEELFVRLERCSIKELRKDAEFLGWTIAESVRLKAQVVSADEREGDLRRVLNFGHTIGHALEAATGYRQFLHGEAVAWGMIAAARIATDVGLCHDSVCERIREGVLRWGKLPPVNLQTAKAIKLMRSDKKTEAGVLHFVLPSKIGRVEVVKDVPESAIAPVAVQVPVNGPVWIWLLMATACPVVAGLAGASARVAAERRTTSASTSAQAAAIIVLAGL